MRALRSPALFVCAFAAALVLGSGAAAADDPYAAMLAPAGACGTAADQLGLDTAAAQVAMQCLTNYARAKQGLAPLQLNATLNTAGQTKLRSDVNCGEFSHTPCGQPFSTVFAAYLQGASSYQIGENIMWGTGSYGTPRQAMNGWLHSTGHRENILTASYTELGIGYLPGQTFQGSTGATLWSQEFGVRAPGRTPVATRAAAGKLLVKTRTKKKTASHAHRANVRRRA